MHCLSAARCATAFADKATFLVNERLLSARGTLHARCLGAVGYVFLQCALNTNLPSVDAFALQLQRTHQLYHVIDRHAIAQNTRDKFGIVPIFGVKLLAQALNCGFISTLILKLEVVTATTIGAYILDDFTLRNRLGQGNALVIVLQTGENFVRIAVEQAHESHPFFLIVLEANNVAGQLFGPNFGHFGLFAGYNGLFFFFLLFSLSRNSSANLL